MEALVILLAEFLSGPIIALVALLGRIGLFVLSFLLDLAFGCFRASARPQRAARKAPKGPCAKPELEYPAPDQNHRAGRLRAEHKRAASGEFRIL